MKIDNQDNPSAHGDTRASIQHQSIDNAKFTRRLDDLRLRFSFSHQLHKVLLRLPSLLQEPLGNMSSARTLERVSTLHVSSLSHRRSLVPRPHEAFGDALSAIVLYVRLIHTEAYPASRDLFSHLLSDLIDLSITLHAPAFALSLLDMLPPHVGIASSDPALVPLHDRAQFVFDALCDESLTGRRDYSRTED